MRWCASRLLVADRSSGTDPILDVGDHPPVRRRTTRRAGEADDARTAHARYFAGREADVLALWDGPRQREAYEWFTLELANLRAAFRWAADHDDLDTAAAIAVYAAFLGYLDRTVRTGRVGRRTHRIRAGCRPPAAGPALRDGGAVLCDRTGRRLRRLRRRRPDSHRQRTFRRGPVRVRGACSAARTCTAGRPERWVEWCRNDHRTRAAALMPSRGLPGDGVDHRRRIRRGGGGVGGPARRRRRHRQSRTWPAMRSSHTAIAHRDADPTAAYDALRRA